MKLRNKKTGKVLKMDIHCIGGKVYESLSEINEEWEDIPEEPKEYWRIDCDGEIEDDKYEGTSFDKDCKIIGNYFDSKEEAEKAVEKLKAWKRLKDKGLRFHDWKEGTAYCLAYDWNEGIKLHEIEADLDLLFGGEE